MSREEAEAALENLSKSDEEWAKARVKVKATKYIMEATHAKLFLDQAGSIKDREAKVKILDEYKSKQEDHKNAEFEYLKIDANRAYWKLLWEDWRSLESSRRQGGL